MADTQSVLWLQGRTHRAGAQTCLARLLGHQDVRAWNPILVCSSEGWLTTEAGRLGIPCIITKFPSSRSLPARFYSNSAFARRVASLVSAPISVVHANDHIEGLLGLALAKRLHARSAIFLRSPQMNEFDYFKYGCHRYEYVGAIGHDLAARVGRWDPRGTVSIVHDGIKKSEFGTPKAQGKTPPLKILVIGSEDPRKGWIDIVAAMRLIEQEQGSPSLQLDFTGRNPQTCGNDIGIDRLVHTRCSFLGRVEKFRDLVSGYGLVINPSRAETFGMAAVEVLAAGVPLLSSRTGIMEEIQTSDEMLFAPARPEELAAKLRNLLANWTKVDFGVAHAQRRIRERFMIDDAASSVASVYRTLTAPTKKQRVWV